MNKVLNILKNLFKKYFIAGTIALLPIAGTIWLLKVIIFAADDFFSSFIPKPFRPESLFGYDIPGLGIIFALFFITLVGVVMRLYIGRWLVRLGDQIIDKIPLGRGIYKGIKQFMNTFLNREDKRYKGVVLVEYPKEHSYALGFVTGECKDDIQNFREEHLIYVFVPTTPNPTSGFLLVVPENKTVPLSMSVEDAFKLIISGGMAANSNS